MQTNNIQKDKTSDLFLYIFLGAIAVSAVMSIVYIIFSFFTE